MKFSLLKYSHQDEATHPPEPQMSATTRLAVIAAALLPCVASAVTVEVGAGVAHYEARGNMMWYQEGLPHRLELNAPAFELGLTGTLLERGRWGLDWHAGYAYMGTAHSDALATPDDRNYSKATKSCVGECIAHSRFVGNGHVHGIKLTLEPTYTYNGIRFGIEAGAYVYRPTWNVTVYNWIPEKGAEPQTITAAGNRHVGVTPVAGVSIGYGNLSVSFLHYFNTGSGAPFHSLWNGTSTLMLRYKF